VGNGCIRKNTQWKEWKGQFLGQGHAKITYIREEREDLVTLLHTEDY